MNFIGARDFSPVLRKQLPLYRAVKSCATGPFLPVPAVVMAHVVVVASAAVRTVAVVMVQAMATAQGQGGYSDEDAHFKEILVHDRKWGQGLKSGLSGAAFFAVVRLMVCGGFRIRRFVAGHGPGFRSCRLVVMSHGFRSRGLVMHHMLRTGCRFVVNHHMLRGRFVVMHHYRLRMHYRMACQIVRIVAEFKSKVVAAAEAYYYHTGHQEHFQEVLVHFSGNRGLCLYKNIAHLKEIFI